MNRAEFAAVLEEPRQALLATATRHLQRNLGARALLASALYDYANGADEHQFLSELVRVVRHGAGEKHPDCRIAQALADRARQRLGVLPTFDLTRF